MLVNGAPGHLDFYFVIYMVWTVKLGEKYTVVCLLQTLYIIFHYSCNLHDICAHMAL